jgi:hypothetical protein
MDHIEEELDGMAIEMLSGLFNNMAYALAGLRGRPAQAKAMRAYVTEYATEIAEILDVWKRTHIEIVDGPGLRALVPRAVYD